MVSQKVREIVDGCIVELPVVVCRFSPVDCLLVLTSPGTTWEAVEVQLHRVDPAVSLPRFAAAVMDGHWDSTLQVSS
jgi:hypothetical protein